MSYSARSSSSTTNVGGVPYLLTWTWGVMFPLPTFSLPPCCTQKLTYTLLHLCLNTVQDHLMFARQQYSASERVLLDSLRRAETARTLVQTCAVGACIPQKVSYFMRGPLHEKKRTHSLPVRYSRIGRCRSVPFQQSRLRPCLHAQLHREKPRHLFETKQRSYEYPFPATIGQRAGTAALCIVQ